MLTTRHKIALARAVQAPMLGIRSAVGRGPEVEVRRRGLNWRLDLREGIDFAIYLMGAFEPSTVDTYSKIVRPGMTVLDIGANIGAHTLHFANLVGPEGRVVAFEPTQWAVEKLRRNLTCNPALVDRVRVMQTMLTSTDVESPPDEIPASWPLAPGADVHPLLRARNMTTEGADASTLDAVLERESPNRVDFIKMDVDGYECQVLSGMQSTLRRFAPPMLMEFSTYGYEEKGGSVEQLMNLFDAVGYRLFHLDTGNMLPWNLTELSQLVPDGAGINVIARPSGNSD